MAIVVEPRPALGDKWRLDVTCKKSRSRASAAPSPFRNNGVPSRSTLSHPFVFFAFIIICCLPLCSATLYIQEQMVETSEEDVAGLGGSTIDSAADLGKILVDPSPPPPASKDWGDDWTLQAIQQLQRRDDPLQTLSSSAVATLTTSSSAGIATAAATSAPSPLPVPFDNGFNQNLTAGCQTFMTNMLSNVTFKQCIPISLLLQNSQSFFQAETSLVRITQTLDASCGASASSCSNVIDGFSRNIATNTACLADLNNLNPLIIQARLGLQAYQPLYTATCLKNVVTNSYCFADAITNSSNPSDNYMYYLPLNVSLPGGSEPSCSQCLHDTMAVFESATAQRDSAIASTFVDAAMMVNVKCGPSFVNSSLAAPLASGARPLPLTGSGMPLIALGLLLASWLM